MSVESPLERLTLRGGVGERGLQHPVWDPPLSCAARWGIGLELICSLKQELGLLVASLAEARRSGRMLRIALRASLSTLAPEAIAAEGDSWTLQV